MNYLKQAIFFLSLVSVAAAQSGQAVTMNQINGYRAKSKLPALTYNNKLEQAAQHHANWMAKNGRMIHMEGQRPKQNTRKAWQKSTWHPINRTVRYGYFNVDHLSHPQAGTYVSEAIAHGGPRSGPGRFQPATIVMGWMKSNGHRPILMGDYKEIGVGFAKTQTGHAYWCVVVAKH
jgi:uncharacterized protein YkwD